MLRNNLLCSTSSTLRSTLLIRIEAVSVTFSPVANITVALIAFLHVLFFFYKGAKEDKKYLGPVLKPYLDGLFASSMENAWFLDEFDAKKCENEFEGKFVK